MEKDKLIELLDRYLNQGHISLLDVEYGNSPINPAFLMRESKKMIIELDKKHKELYNDYTNLSEEYRELNWQMESLKK